MGFLLIAGFSSCGGQREAEERGEQAVAAIEKLGGEVEVDRNEAVVRVELTDSEATDAVLEHLKRLTKLKHLDLLGTKVTLRRACS